MNPKIIHQTWANDKPPEQLAIWSKTWKDHHPNHEHLIHTDEDNERLVMSHFPKHLESYRSFPHNIQRVDIARLMWLYVYGGIYADMDVECLRNTDTLPPGCVLFLEPNANKMGLTETPANWVIKADPYSPFIRMALDLSMEEFHYSGFKLPDVCMSTGTGLLRRAYAQCKFNFLPTPWVFSSTCFSPYTHEQVLESRRRRVELDRNINAYGIHHFLGSWW